ncbi:MULTISPECIES: DNA polymerase thumb domain-containing protein [Streptacidiphilus]|uniref:UmuC domain-containing protein n=1 Tax=Streptacidiphilus cavernicola TaxID=3342716 RepID=A0ABV6UN45_9ACTN|nr:DNA polymerase [Streptacidiphilus jeojiense]
MTDYQISILHVVLRRPGVAAPLAAEAYDQVLGLLRGITPVVEPLPPDAALLDVRGAQRYFGTDAVQLAEMIRVRALAQQDVDCTIGLAANPLLARLAANTSMVGGIHVLADPEAARAFLDPLPVLALPGVGQATARTLGGYGLDTVGRLAAAPLPTLQRILGASAGRQLHQRARGIDPTPVATGTPTRSLAAEHSFDRDELDPVEHRRALLDLTHHLGARLRAGGQATGALTLTVRYADRSTSTRSRTLAEPTAHTPALTTTAYRLHDTLGLQRARVRGITLRAEGIRPAELAPHQLSLDPVDDRNHRIEAVIDRTTTLFGSTGLTRASLRRVA